MDGELIPSGYGMMTPWIANLFENIAAVQFNHRLLAVAAVTLALALWLWSLSRDLAPADLMGFAALAILALVQPALRIHTLLTVVPGTLAPLHQAAAVLGPAGTRWHDHR